MKPAISIIIPVHNIENYLRGCLASILTQSFTNYEVILVNDGSTDSSGDICNQYVNRDMRFRVIHLPARGVSAARNAGIRAANGDYIGFVDGDDHINPDMYEKMYQLCMDTNSDIAVCKLGREIDGVLINKEEEVYMREMDNAEAMRELFKGVLYRFSLCNKLFKKSCFEGVTFPEGRIHEDLSTTYKLFFHASKVIYTNFIGYIYVKRKNSILTSTFNAKRLDAFIGWGEILQFMKDNYPLSYNEVTACFAYGCIDNMNYILNQVQNRKDKKKYLGTVQYFLRGVYHQEVLKHSELTLRQKYILSKLNYNLEWVLITYRLKRLLVKV